MKKQDVILITGATSGIGHALAEHYAAPGATLLLTGRNAARMEEVATTCRAKGAIVETTTTDVTDREAFEARVRAWDDAHPVSLVIANAGISGGLGRDSAETDRVFREIMRINVDGTFNTVAPLVDRMVKRGRGQIALMSSIAGFRGLPSAVAYSVSKNAVRAYGEALRPLLKSHGVRVNIICPGFIKTPLTDVNSFPMPFLMEVHEAAERIVRGLEKDRPVIAFPWQMWMMIEFLCCLPRRLSDWILAKAPRKG
jgi:short-subunit dehydrogenase